MRLLIAYATTDGQTRKIARRVGEIAMNSGYSVELLPAGEAQELDLTQYRAVVLAGSVHVGGYQKALSDFAALHKHALNRMPGLFLSVSLSAAGTDDADWKGLEKVVSEFVEATGWTPPKIVHVAGAFRFSTYDVFRGFVMRRIAAQKDAGISTDKDHEYTDWVKLGRDVGDWLKGVGTS